MKTTIEDRFLSKVAMIPFHPCWEWIGAKDHGSYGFFKLKGRARLAHRVSFELFNGPITDDLFVCHHCDNPSCVNPRHLFLGTNSDNMVDSFKKGRLKLPNKTKTHCKWGHEFNHKNTRIYHRKDRIERCCRACDRIGRPPSLGALRERPKMEAKVPFQVF